MSWKLSIQCLGNLVFSVLKTWYSMSWKLGIQCLGNKVSIIVILHLMIDNVNFERFTDCWHSISLLIFIVLMVCDNTNSNVYNKFYALSCPCLLKLTKYVKLVVFAGLLISGFVVFAPKFVESQFSISAAWAAQLIGMKLFISSLTASTVLVYKRR